MARYEARRSGIAAHASQFLCLPAHTRTVLVLVQGGLQYQYTREGIRLLHQCMYAALYHADFPAKSAAWLLQMNLKLELSSAHM